jgi:hypothetical protein
MNYVGLLAVLVGLTIFGLTWRYLARAKTPPSIWLWVLASVLALPALTYALYYSRLMGEPIWLYRLRAVPGSEMLAAASGFLAALVQVRAIPRLRLSPLGRITLVPIVLAVGLLLPYLKPVFRPLHPETLSDVWIDGVCHQSSGGTCGPASVATILRQLGVNANERELAEEAYSAASGTENWYLARAIKKRGPGVNFLKSSPATAPLPAVAGVRLLSTGGAGHFVALLGRTNELMVIADPLEGRQTLTLQQLAAKYEFTGFFLAIKPKNK